MSKLTLLLSLGFALVAAPLAQTRVAVLDFRNNGPKDLEYLQAGVASMLTTTLAQSQELQLVERDQLDKLVAEMSLGASGLVDPNTAAELGKISGAQWVVIGSFLPLGKAIRLDAKVVDVATGSLLRNGTHSMRANSVETLDEAVDKLAVELLKNLTGEKARAPQAAGDPGRKGILEILPAGTEMVGFIVNGEPQMPVEFSNRYEIEVGHGTHSVQAAKGAFKITVLAEQQVFVPGGFRVKLRYHKGKMEIIETIALPAPPAPPAKVVAPEPPRPGRRQRDEEPVVHQRMPERRPEDRLRDQRDPRKPVAPAPVAPAPSGPVAMDESDFNALVQMLENESFESNKLPTLQSLLGTNRLSIAQVERLLDLFGFESNRLDVAKFLYPLLVEKNLAAVGRIQSKFGFSSTKTTFTEWVSKQPK